MGIKRIRAVSRAIEVLRSLQRSPGQTLADLHKSTRLPKATLERILATLDDEQVVWRAMADGGYRNTLHFQHRDRAYMKNHHLAEIAMPHLEALRKRTIWPSDLAVRHGYAMVLLETTRSRAGLGLFRDQIGQPINMPYSAVGRAYLAFCPERERAMLIRHVFNASRGVGMPAAAEGARAVLEKLLASARALGYAVRDPLFGRRGRTEALAEDHLAAIAVPILAREKVLGCINLVWPKKFELEKRIVRLYLGDLQRTAANLSKAATADSID